MLNTKVPFIIHEHEPRNGSKHYDLRFINPKDSKVLFSFAAPSKFLESLSKKSLVIRTREHDKRWLTLKSYRLKTIDEGIVDVRISTDRYFDLYFEGKIINGHYKLFKMKNTYRDDHWLLVKV